MAHYGIVRHRQLSGPEGFAAAAAIFCALPENPHAPAEISGREWTDGPNRARTVQHVDTFDRRSTDDLGNQSHSHWTWPNYVAHRGVLYGKFFARTELRIIGKSSHRLIEGPVHFNEHASAGRTVVSPLAQRLE